MGDTDRAGATPPTSTPRIATAVTIGTVIEWYDFFLYGTAAALIFPKVFFPAGDPTVASLLSFASFATGFAARPVGGLVFGHLGDRLGRKAVLVVTLVLMGAATTGVGLLPGYAEAGLAAPVALVVLRIVQGLGTGGEWGGAALMMKENGARRPGFVGGFLSSAVFAGLILGSLAFTALSGILTEAQLLDWGWRIPFLVSIVLVGIGLWIRRSLPETAEFREVSERGDRERAPIVAALRRPRNVVAIFLMRVGQNATFNIVSVFVLTYATTTLGLPKASVLTATVVGAALGCVLCPLYGLLGDHLGFRRVMVGALAFQALFAFPFFWLIDSRDMVLVVLAVTVGIAGGVAAADAIQPAYFTGLFGPQSRFSAVSIGREGGTVIGGGLAPLIAAALLAWQDGRPWAIAAWMVVTSLVGLVGVFLVRPVADGAPAAATATAATR